MKSKLILILIALGLSSSAFADGAYNLYCPEISEMPSSLQANTQYQVRGVTWDLFRDSGTYQAKPTDLKFMGARQFAPTPGVSSSYIKCMYYGTLGNQFTQFRIVTTSNNYTYNPAEFDLLSGTEACSQFPGTTEPASCTFKLVS